MAEAEEEERTEDNHCCISHEFFKSASQNLHKIAVIHASGGARICREFGHNSITTTNNKNDDDDFFSSFRHQSNQSFLQRDEFFTYSEILSSVNSLCYRIRRVLDGGGHDPDLIKPNESERIDNTDSPQILGIYMVPSVEYIVTVLSVLRSGEAFLPLDPSWPKHRILSIISLSKVALILKCKTSFDSTDTHQLKKSQWMADRSGCAVLEMSMKENCEKEFECLDLVWPCQSVKPRKFCYLLYTSGSTGKPKGVCGTETGLLNRYLWMQELFPLHEEEILLFKTSISFIDHLQEFLSAILTCIPLVIPPFEEFKINPFYIADFLKAYCISRLIMVPTVMRAILPAIQSPYCRDVQAYLKVLVLSGEVLSVFLWDVLHKLLPKTSILNLYGSTEVSGDCTYFDCKRLPRILETELLSSVPIGIPISNCKVILVGENEFSQGEIYVGGTCTSVGYFHDPTVLSLDYIELSQVYGHCNGIPLLDEGCRSYFRTGDYARRLHTGDLVFIGRKDRTLKLNGQRVALEEVESNLREHPDIIDVAVISYEGQGKFIYLIAYIVVKANDEIQMLDSHIRKWLVKRLPPALIPNRYVCIESLPRTSSGKVDYSCLPDPAFLSNQIKSNADITQGDSDLLEVIEKAFSNALMIGKVKKDDDFFEMGGNSIAAAQVAYKLGIDMRVLYTFPSPYKLLSALRDNELAYKFDFGTCFDWEHKSKPKPAYKKRLSESSLGICSGANDESALTVKRLKVDSDMYPLLNTTTSGHDMPWISNFRLSKTCSFSRCNKVVYGGINEANDVRQACWSAKYPINSKGSMHELWKVHLKSCVDASPLVVFKDGNAYVFIGSHSHTFLCVDAVSGILQWETILEGRIECSAAIVDDFSQVVVGCYEGKVYFLDFMTGNISWAFDTQGEVKSQPVLDMERKLIWCGSYDHNLYALDYKNHCCVFHISCGGSIYGSPSINTVHNMLYVASTMGRVTAILIEASPFRNMWIHELGAPVFGTLVSSPNGNVICCSVNGHVTVLSLSGSVVWKAITGGPIFGGACLSNALPSQVLVCSRNGSIYSFDLEKGDLLWEYNIADPITSSAYVDENMQLTSDPFHPLDRLACICSSSGSLHVLRVNSGARSKMKQAAQDEVSPTVQEFAKMELPGDIFSSPVMIGGQIYIGCRDDFMYCIKVEVSIPM
ncbi:D-alanine--d-alanyl carrier protein ligase [Thalictrum thalictroides]|uniref:D-alanine--d-alanyl carrier protein ligase n=1 Tax=Thalictrum thalictroides TaxID=46969 RepID=A0A7J6USV8_THATH|nr:D-alanine--d-alanyl carrier protein ligase [Thalictrum thalictroides]